jgi:ferredoxin
MQANVDRDLCIGCNLCVEICPEVFVMGDDMIAKVIVGEVPAALEEKANDAKASCPVDAISMS